MNPQSDDIKYLIIVGISVMLLLMVSFLLLFIINQKKKLQYQQQIQNLNEQQQNQLIEAAVRSEEIERHRIAETLHDEVGAILSSARLHFTGIKSDQLEPRERQIYDKGKDLLDDAIKQVRGISHNLHSNILKEFGLNEAIKHFLDKISKQDVLKTSTALDQNYTTQNTENDISIYRMVQELVNNIIKHANAHEIIVSSSFNNHLLTLTLFHDGKGLTQQEFEKLRFNKEGLGLKNIQNRIILLRGKINFMTAPDGNRIRIEVPVKSEL
jgi:two-component system NarL family sensor kinase